MILSSDIIILQFSYIVTYAPIALTYLLWGTLHKKKNLQSTNAKQLLLSFFLNRSCVNHTKFKQACFSGLSSLNSTQMQITGKTSPCILMRYTINYEANLKTRMFLRQILLDLSILSG